MRVLLSRPIRRAGALMTCRPHRRLQRESVEATLIECPAPLAGCIEIKVRLARRNRLGWFPRFRWVSTRRLASLNICSTAETRETRPLLGKGLPIDPVQWPLPVRCTFQVRCTSRTCACHVCQSQLVSTPAPAVSNPRSAPRQLVSAPSPGYSNEVWGLTRSDAPDGHAHNDESPSRPRAQLHQLALGPTPGALHPMGPD